MVVSVQVLQEFYAQATRLSHPNRLSHDDAMQFLDTLPTEAIQELTVDVFRRATTLCQRYQVSYWDAAILAAAQEAGCDAVLSEDLNAEQDYDGMTVINPFVTCAFGWSASAWAFLTQLCAVSSWLTTELSTPNTLFRTWSVARHHLTPQRSI